MLRALLAVSCIHAFGVSQTPEAPKPAFRGIENAIGMVTGEDHCYAIQAPKGWVIDNSIWAEQGVFAVFYQSGKSLQESPLVGFSRIHPKHPKGITVLVQEDLAASIQGSKFAKVKQHTDIRTKDGMPAGIFSIEGVPNQNSEWVAYIDAPTVVILVGVSIRPASNLTDGHKLLKELVSSIQWVHNGLQRVK